MTILEVKVTCPGGLESRRAAVFIQTASRFKSLIWIKKDERKANAKSLLGVMSLSIPSDSLVTLSAEGEDEKEAVNTLFEFLTTL